MVPGFCWDYTENTNGMVPGFRCDYSENPDGTVPRFRWDHSENPEGMVPGFRWDHTENTAGIPPVSIQKLNGIVLDTTGIVPEVLKRPFEQRSISSRTAHFLNVESLV